MIPALETLDNIKATVLCKISRVQGINVCLPILWAAKLHLGYMTVDYPLTRISSSIHNLETYSDLTGAMNTNPLENLPLHSVSMAPSAFTQ